MNGTSCVRAAAGRWVLLALSAAWLGLFEEQAFARDLSDAYSEDGSSTVVSSETNGYVVNPYLQQVTKATSPGDESALIPTGALILYCGDGDGCQLSLVVRENSSTLLTTLARRALHVAASGTTWQLIDPLTELTEEYGFLNDSQLETILDVGDSASCRIVEDNLILGGVGYFLKAYSNDPLGSGSDCLLRLDD